MGPATTSEHSNWDIAEGITVECPKDVVDRMRQLAVRGLKALPGGLETGGILYGARQGGHVSILSFLELECEHALGPRFILSEHDQEAIPGLLQTRDGSQAVGWFRVHTRSNLDPDAHDRSLFDRHFAESMSIALILKPTDEGPASAAFYVRDVAGGLLPATPNEFILEPLHANPLFLETPVLLEDEPSVESFFSNPRTPVAGSGEAQSSHTRTSFIGSPEPQEDEPSVESFFPNRRTRDAGTGQAQSSPPRTTELEPPVRWGMKVPRVWVWISCAITILTMAALFTSGSFPSRRNRLQAYSEAPGQVRIEWNGRTSGSERGSGVLSIEDGDLVTVVPLDSSQIRSGGMTYVQHTRHITARLKLDQVKPGDTPTEDTLEFVGTLPPQLRVAETSPVAAPLPVMSISPRAVTANVAPEKPAERPLPKPAARIPIGKPAAVILPAPLPSPPAVASPAVGLTAMPEFLAAPPVRASEPTPPVASRRPSYTGARSGRLIWTGVLSKHGVIELDGSHVSVGSISGFLPGVSVSLSVLPAEFGRDGLVAYTQDSSKAGKDEAPSKANGWNATHFRLNGERAGQMTIIEGPNGSNDFKRLVLRNEGKDCSVLIVDWIIK